MDHIEGGSFSLAGTGGGVTRREPSKTEIKSQLAILSKVEQDLRGVPEAVIKGIPLGTSSADPAKNQAFNTVRRHIEQLIMHASDEPGIAEVEPVDLEDPNLAHDYNWLAYKMGTSMRTRVRDGRFPETIFTRRRFLAHRESFSRAGLVFFGTPVYVATV